MNNILSEEKRQQIANKLNSKGLKMVCPMCGNNHFTVIDGYFNNALQGDLQNLNFGGPSLPACVIACEKCGFISQHALGALGLL